MDLCRFTLASREKLPIQERTSTPLEKEYKRRMVSLLHNVPLEKLDADGELTGLFSFSRSSKDGASLDPFGLDSLRSAKIGATGNDNSISTGYSYTATKAPRKIAAKPSRILGAPDIVDDFYLNLISWSKDNILAIALQETVYLWNATTLKSHALKSLEDSNFVTSVSWCEAPGSTHIIGVGTSEGSVHIFDARDCRSMGVLTSNPASRVSSLAWSGEVLSAGGQDGTIVNWDLNSNRSCWSVFKGHEDGVCGLRWDRQDTYSLASGANDNRVCIWDARFSTNLSHHAPRLVLSGHKAAVKALAWCPFKRGVLATGGGTADRTIKFWNSASGTLTKSVDTSSQVCSLDWNMHERELISSHGYSDNLLIVWDYPTMTKVTELNCHKARILGTAFSPDGNTLVSAGADEILCFWQINNVVTRASKNVMSDFSFGGPVIH